MGEPCNVVNVFDECEGVRKKGKVKKKGRGVKLP
jgi:hypothetical protein